MRAHLTGAQSSVDLGSYVTWEHFHNRCSQLDKNVLALDKVGSSIQGHTTMLITS